MQLSPWPLVAAVYNLEVANGLRDGPFITAVMARKLCNRATAKLTRLLVRQGIDEAAVRAYFRLRDEGTARMHENLAALLPPPTRVHDAGDPRRASSLRAVR